MTCTYVQVISFVVSGSSLFHYVVSELNLDHRLRMVTMGDLPHRVGTLYIVKNSLGGLPKRPQKSGVISCLQKHPVHPRSSQ